MTSMISWPGLWKAHADPYEDMVVFIDATMATTLSYIESYELSVSWTVSFVVKKCLCLFYLVGSKKPYGHIFLSYDKIQKVKEHLYSKKTFKPI